MSLQAGASRLLRFGRGPQVVALVLFVALLGAMVVEPARQLLTQRDRVAGLASDLEEIEGANDKLRGRIKRLKDPDFIEQKAREQAGLVRPGEVPIVVMPPSGDRRASAPERRKPQVSPVEDDPGFVEGLLEFVGFM